MFHEEAASLFAGKKPSLKRCIKRRRFLRPFSSDEENTVNETDISIYAPHKSYYTSKSRPYRSHSTVFEADKKNEGATEPASEQLNQRLTPRIAVIYELQTWERDIVIEKEVKHKHGRSHKPYHVSWEYSSVYRSHLHAPELLQNWKEKKASKRKR